MIDDKDSHLPSPLIMFTCTTLRHTLVEWQRNKGVNPKTSKSKLNADRPDRSNYFNYKNDSGKNASCCTATGRKLLTSPGIADTYTFLTNTWNTLKESYQQRVYKNTLATVKRQIRQAENPKLAMVIRVKAARVDKAILLDYLTSKVALEEPEIRSTDPNIPMDNNCIDDELHFGMPGGSGEYKDQGGESDELDAIPTSNWQQRAATELERMDLGTCDVDGNEGEDGDDADADEEEEASQAMMDQRRMRRTEGIVGFTWEPVMSTYMKARMATLRMRMTRKMHRKLMMHQRRMWRTEGIVIESSKIRHYISDL